MLNLRCWLTATVDGPLPADDEAEGRMGRFDRRREMAGITAQPMAQTKPASSRAIAAMTIVDCFTHALGCRYRAQSRIGIGDGAITVQE